MPIKINGSTSGSTTITAPATGTDETIELSTALAAKAPLASPTFTGTPALPATTTVGGVAGFGAWTAYTPSTNITVGNGTLVARYARIGKLVVGFVSFTLGSTSSIATNSYFSLPVTPYLANSILPVGYAHYVDSDTATEYTGTVRADAGYLTHTVAASNAGRVAATAPFTWAVNDGIGVAYTYEAA